MTGGALNDRSCAVLSNIVDAYIETGEPVGSKTLSARLGMQISSATIRNIMASLEQQGYLYAPHTSAGRLPTEEGLRFFVKGLLEIGDLSVSERSQIERISSNLQYEDILQNATEALSGLSKCAGLVVAPRYEETLKHLEFVPLNDGRALVVMVTESGQVENRVIELPDGVSSSTLKEASNYLNSHIVGATLMEAGERISKELAAHKASLDTLAASLVEQGLAVWSGEQKKQALIVRGQANLLNGVTSMEEMDTLRTLFEALETKTSFATLLDAAQTAEGIQIFIGSDNNLFKMNGCSLIVAPFKNAKEHIIGAIGVIGPTRVNYGRVIPMVNCTANVMTRALAGS